METEVHNSKIILKYCILLGCTLSYTYYVLILYLDSISIMTCSISCRLSMTLYGLTEWKINEWMNEWMRVSSPARKVIQQLLTSSELWFHTYYILHSFKCCMIAWWWWIVPQTCGYYCIDTAVLDGIFSFVMECTILKRNEFYLKETFLFSC